MENKSQENNIISIMTADETPRMKCLREAQEAHNRCLVGAENDAEKSECHAALSKAEKACPRN